MPEGQNRAEGEQAGSRAEQGPERRGNISVSQLQTPHSPHRQMDLSMAQLAPEEALGPRARYEKRQSPSWARVSGRMECG